MTFSFIIIPKKKKKTRCLNIWFCLYSWGINQALIRQELIFIISNDFPILSETRRLNLHHRILNVLNHLHAVARKNSVESGKWKWFIKERSVLTLDSYIPSAYPYDSYIVLNKRFKYPTLAIIRYCVCIDNLILWDIN